MKKFKIYCLKCPDSLNIRYIGVTSQTLSSRFSQHMWDSKFKNTHKAKWIFSLLEQHKKPIIELIEEVDEDLWEDKEIYWIHYYSNIYDLTNHDKGGKGIILNRDFSGRDRSRRSKFKKVYQFNIDMTFIKEWDSPTIASEQLQISCRSIHKCCSKKAITNPTAGGYRWFYKIEYDNNNHIVKKYTPKNEYPQCILVFIYENNILIDTKKSITECSIYYNIPDFRLRRNLKKGEYLYNNKVFTLTEKI